MNPRHPIISKLIDAGAWPTGNLNSIAEAAVRSIAPDEERICLLDPKHFRTVEHDATNGVVEFWQEFGALTEIDPARSWIIGDFGLGSDSPIIIQSDPSAADPEVLRLLWSCEGRTAITHWTTLFARLSDFGTFLYQQQKNIAEQGACTQPSVAKAPSGE